MNATASKNGENEYSINLVARMNMPDSLAKAAILGSDQSVLDRVRIISTLTISDDIDIDWSSVKVEEAAYNMTGLGTTFTYEEVNYPVYEFVSITRSENKIILTYKLSEDCKKNIRYLGVDGGVAALRKEVVISCNLENVAVSSFGENRAIESEVELTGYNGTILAASGNTKVRFDDEPEAEGVVTVLTVDAKPGDKVEAVIDPAPGKKVTSISVVDKDGNTITFDYNGDGNFNFEMPDSEYEIVVNYDEAPYTPNDSGVEVLLNTDEHIPYVIGNDQGTFKPYDGVLRCEVAMMFYRLLRNPNIEITSEFEDVDDSKWYATAIKTLATLGIFKGENGKVRPEDPMTRAEFASVAVHFATIEPHKKDVVFNDVSAELAEYDDIRRAAAYGWIVGYDGNFYPDQIVNRSEACTIINRMLARPGDDTSMDEGEGINYPDVQLNSDWGYYAITEATTDHDTEMDYVIYNEDWSAVRG